MPPADPAPFDPAAWAARWTALGGRIEWDGLRWPFPIWLQRDKPGDDLRLMPLDLTAERGVAGVGAGDDGGGR